MALKECPNKECSICCSTYLGCHIAEHILSLIFKDVERMPINNPGYDFICNRGKKIDVKSSALGYKGGWKYSIKRNQIAEYFLCLAFESRDDLYNPVHLWLIPADDINHLTGIAILKTTINKWKQYELPLNKLVTCCNSLR